MAQRAINFIDRTGKRYGKLTILSFQESRIIGSNRKKPYWLCECDCGRTCVRAGEGMVSGAIKSCGCLLTAPQGESGLKDFYHSYKSNAKNRGIKFNISIGYFKKIITKNCKYCGSPPNKVQLHRRKRLTKSQISHMGFIANGIDRLVNRLGYIRGNCVSCCEWCNRMKLKASRAEFINHCKKIANNNL